MRRPLFALLAVAMIAVLVTPGACQTRTARAPSTPGAIAVDVSQVTVKVTDVNPTARTVTLETPDGRTMTYKVDKSVKGLGAIRKGETIRATLLDSMAVYVQRQGSKPTVTETSTVMLSPKRAVPGVIVANTTRITGRVQTVNLQNRRVTITGPGGTSRAFKVGPNVRDLGNVRAGDSVVIRFTEALALDLQKPRK